MDIIHIMEAKANLQLVEITEYDFTNYSEEALTAAKSVLDSRNLSQEMLKEIHEHIQKESNIQKLVNGVSNSIQKKDKEYQKELGSTDRLFFYLLLGLFSLFMITPLYYVIVDLSLGFSDTWYYVVQFIQITLTAFILQRLIQRKKVGWVWGLYYGTIAVILSILKLISNLIYYFFYYTDIQGDFGLLINEFTGSWPLYEISTGFVMFAIHFLVVWLLRNKRIQEMYMISNPFYNKHQLKSIVFGIILVILMNLLPFLYYYLINNF